MGGTKSASNREDVPVLAWRQPEPGDFSVGGGEREVGPCGPGACWWSNPFINKQADSSQTNRVFWCRRAADG